jgi:hypothetical protein
MEAINVSPCWVPMSGDLSLHSAGNGIFITPRGHEVCQRGTSISLGAPNEPVAVSTATFEFEPTPCQVSWFDIYSVWGDEDGYW